MINCKGVLMFSKFNYSPSNSFYNTTINKYLSIGNEIYSEHQKEVQKCLAEYISEDGVINGTNLKEDWFSITKKDVFISHSHNDINKVKAFAGWLHEVFGLEVFIDSCSWGYCDELLNRIDKKYCYKKIEKTYDYELRNYTTSHVHMMLSTALSEMIDNTECIIFFNTPSSINMSDELNAIKKKEKTTSPWIYHELMMTTLLKTNKPKRNKVFFEQYSSQIEKRKEPLKISYDVDKITKDMTKLTDDNLKEWNSNWINSPKKITSNSLDVLYNIIFPN